MSSIRKAIAAGVGAMGTGLVASVSDGAFTLLDIVIVVGGTLATFGATWGMTNEPM